MGEDDQGVAAAAGLERPVPAHRDLAGACREEKPPEKGGTRAGGAAAAPAGTGPCSTHPGTGVGMDPTRVGVPKERGSPRAGMSLTDGDAEQGGAPAPAQGGSSQAPAVLGARDPERLRSPRPRQARVEEAKEEPLGETRKGGHRGDSTEGGGRVQNQPAAATLL